MKDMRECAIRVYRRRASRWKAKIEQRPLGRCLLVHLRTAKGPVAGVE